MFPRSMFPASLLLLAAVPGLTAQQAKQATPGKDELVREAMAAAPKEIAMGAAIMAPGADGKLTQLRPGTNGWTCLPDAPDTPGRDAMCADKQAMIWVSSWIKHEPEPANTAPGLVYMLTGGSDISATDPWAKPAPGTKWVESPPHYMITGLTIQSPADLGHPEEDRHLDHVGGNAVRAPHDQPEALRRATIAMPGPTR